MPEHYVFLVRHGRTAMNAAGQLRGRLDPPLDDVGRVEAFALARELAYSRPARIVTSPLQRAVQTGHPLSSQLHVDVTIEPRLIDRDYGAFAGLETADVVRRFGSVDAAPGVEPRQQVINRARAALDDQTPHLGAGAVVLIAHDVVNRLLLASLDPRLGAADSIGQRTGCWNVLRHADDGWHVEQIDLQPDSRDRAD